MTEAQPEVSADRHVARVLDVLLAYKGETLNELILATGIGKHTMIRRRRSGGWSVNEIAALADHFGQPVEVFFQGPDNLFRPGRVSRTYLTAA